MALRTYKTCLSVASIALVTACGGGGGGDSPTVTPPTTTVPPPPTTTPPPPPPPDTTPPPASGPTLSPASALPDGTVLGAAGLPTGPANASVGGRGQVVSGLGCGLTGSAYHVQTQLSVFKDGLQLAVPANIGNVAATTTQAACLYPVHTDDQSGKIQVEAPAKSLFTLGQFFDLWGQPLTTTNVAGQTSSSIKFYINDGGTLSEFKGDPRTIELAAHREVKVVIGSVPTKLPAYTWVDTPPLAATPIDLNPAQAIGAFRWEEKNTPTGGQGQPVQGITCGAELETYHVHTHISFFLNGQQIALPGLLGIVNPPTVPARCLYTLHTHTQTGKIHVEAGAVAKFTLGQFFAIWGMPLSRTSVADFPTTLPITFYINDGFHTYQYMGDPKDIELTSKRNITVQVGTTIPLIPTYDWSGL